MNGIDGDWDYRTEVIEVPRKKQNVGKNLQSWVIKDVDNEVRRYVRIYAARWDLTLAQALKELVIRGAAFDSLDMELRGPEATIDHDQLETMLAAQRAAFQEQNFQRGPVMHLESMGWPIQHLDELHKEPGE